MTVLSFTTFSFSSINKGKEEKEGEGCYEGNEGHERKSRCMQSIGTGGT